MASARPCDFLEFSRCGRFFICMSYFVAREVHRSERAVGVKAALQCSCAFVPHFIPSQIELG